LEWTWWLGEHFQQRPVRTITIFGMNRLGLVSESLAVDALPYRISPCGVDQRDRIGAVFDERLQALECRCHGPTSIFLNRRKTFVEQVMGRTHCAPAAPVPHDGSIAVPATGT
jgi:hypothetical protein